MQVVNLPFTFLSFYSLFLIRAVGVEGAQHKQFCLGLSGIE